MHASPPRPGSRATSDSADPIATALRILRVFILLAVAAWVVLWFKYSSDPGTAPTANQGRKFGGPDMAGAGPLVQAVRMSGDNQPGRGGFAAVVGFGGTGRTVPAPSRLEPARCDVRLPSFSSTAGAYPWTSPGPA